MILIKMKSWNLIHKRQLDFWEVSHSWSFIFFRYNRIKLLTALLDIYTMTTKHDFEPKKAQVLNEITPKIVTGVSIMKANKVFFY